jgi:hypothetical protein
MSILNKLSAFLEADQSQKFSIPLKIKSNLKISGNLGNAENWKAKIILGNSMGKDKKVGDWDKARYVAIDLKSNTIVPIAISDEHQTGRELIWHYENKNLIPHGNYRYVDSWGTTYIYTNNDVDMVAAFKKFKMYGGNGNLKVKSMGGKYNGTIDDYIKRNGEIILGEAELAIHGKHIIADIEYIANEYKKFLMLEKKFKTPNDDDIQSLFNFTINFLQSLIDFDGVLDELHVNFNDKIKSILNDDIIEKMISRIKIAEPKLDYDVIGDEILSMNGIKNRLHQALKIIKLDKDTGSYSPKSYFNAVFGNIDTAIAEFNRLGEI